MVRAKRLRIAVASALACLSAIHAGRADTWIVDDDGPANFRDLPDAVAAAHDGDLLLVRAGHYSPVSIAHKGLSIIGAGARSVTIERIDGEGPFLDAKELSARQTLVVSGVTGIGRGSTIAIERCAGLVLLTDLVVESRHPSRAGAGPSLQRCQNAVLTRVAVLPGTMPAPTGAFGLSVAKGDYMLTQVVAIGAPAMPGRSPSGHGGVGHVGLAASDARVVVGLSEFVGGAGGAAVWDAAAPFCREAATGGAGGSGVYVSGKSDVVIAGDGAEQLRGGDGGDATKNPWENCWSYAGDGGAGVRVSLDDAERHVLLSSIDAVAGKAGATEGGRAGKSGRDIDGDSSDPSAQSVTVADAPLPTLAIEDSAVTGGTIHLRVRGQPEDRLTFIVSSILGRAHLKGVKGFPLCAIPGAFWIMLPQGRIDKDGKFAAQIDLPQDKELIGKCFAIQALVVPPAKSRRDSLLSNVDVLVIADGSSPPAEKEK